MSLIGILMTLPCSAQETPQSVDIDTAFRRVKADNNLQFDLPQRIVEVDPPRRLDWLGDLLDFLAPIAEILVWVFVALVVAGIAWFVITSLRDVKFRKRKTKDVETPELYEPDAIQVEALLGEVDALAAEGRYREAVHVLLFKAIAQIDRSRPGLVRRSLTSREIGRHPGLTGRTREAFVEIARINEAGWFAGRDTDRAQFEAARAAYAQFGRDAETLPRLSGVALA